MNFEQLFADFSNTRVAILGDVMLDTYWWGSVDRISPEAPVPVVALKRKELRVGGAANVALNTASLGAKTTMIAVIGADADGEQLIQLLQEKNIDTQYIKKATNRVTTNKTRVMSRNQQMMRLDAEITTDIDTETENILLEQVKLCIEIQKPQVLILEDYNKGVLTPRIIKEVIALCKAKNIITAVDPKKKNFLAYHGVTIFKPNLKEVKEGLNLLTDTIDLSSLKQIHETLQQHLQHHISLITLSEKGVFYQDETAHRIIPTHIRNIADVSGAGDTVIAVTSLCYAVTKDMHLAAEMANIAGGLVCEEVGTAAINKERLLQECELLLGE
ncbi:bifunctional ADP-heptose synthase [Sediminibacterium sp.]|uniref:bifunctional heptose 7-phosphate kinase/heptose 1-phosphate adenyltransferase n=1 Tax=Sediminibacterium sp. TaxID=1917865 RepID=UPI0025E71016|nr:bifunctional ADP-heptose synthase [Sediminibacterium sp.]MBW0179263.1 carbohydrate kinase [Sediminibacterium sp.]